MTRYNRLWPAAYRSVALVGCLRRFAWRSPLPRAPFVATPPMSSTGCWRSPRSARTDVVYDLGSGDGRIVIAAAQKFGARGVGVDIDPARIAESEENARRAGVERLVTFRLQDALKTDVSDATVVTLYMLSRST